MCSINYAVAFFYISLGGFEQLYINWTKFESSHIAAFSMSNIITIIIKYKQKEEWHKIRLKANKWLNTEMVVEKCFTNSPKNIILNNF